MLVRQHRPGASTALPCSPWRLWHWCDTPQRSLLEPGSHLGGFGPMRKTLRPSRRFICAPLAGRQCRHRTVLPHAPGCPSPGDAQAQAPARPCGCCGDHTQTVHGRHCGRVKRGNNRQASGVAGGVAGMRGLAPGQPAVGRMLSRVQPHSRPAGTHSPNRCSVLSTTPGA